MTWPFDSPDTYRPTPTEALKELREIFGRFGVDSRVRFRGLSAVGVLEAAMKESERFKGDVAGDY